MKQNRYDRKPFTVFPEKEPFKFSSIEIDDLLLPNSSDYDSTEEDWIDNQVRIHWRKKMIDEILKNDDED